MRTFKTSSAFAVLPRAPRTTSPVPWLTSLHATVARGPYGDWRYPGNCGGHLIKDLLRHFAPTRVFDPMTGSGTCRDVCDELGIECVSKDIRSGFDACDPANFTDLPRFDFIWIHPPYWRQKIYSDHPRDLSAQTTLATFLKCYAQLLRHCTSVLAPGGKFAVLMGDYQDREAGFVPLVFHTKRLAFNLRLRQHCTDIIRFSHGASSSGKTYATSFIPGLHDVCMIFEKPLSPTSFPPISWQHRKHHRQNAHTASGRMTRSGSFRTSKQRVRSKRSTLPKRGLIPGSRVMNTTATASTLGAR